MSKASFEMPAAGWYDRTRWKCFCSWIDGRFSERNAIMTRWGMFTLAAMMLTATGCSPWKDSRYRSAMRNTAAKDFELESLSGESVKLSQFRGRPVVLSFFAFG